MNVTYKDLKDGYILKDRDEVVIHGAKHRAMLSDANNGYYLNYEGVSNDTLDYDRTPETSCNDFIFHLLHISDKDSFVKDIAGKDFSGTGSFPQVKTLEALTKVAIALLERPLYNVGDYVTVRKEIEGHKYSLTYWEFMKVFAGKTLAVTKIESKSENALDTDSDGEIYLYELDDNYVWDIAMIMPANEEEKKSVGASDKEEPEEKKEEETPSKKKWFGNPTYFDLNNGRILEKGDVLNIHGLVYRVTDGGFNGKRCWLAASDDVNRVIFNKLHIDDKYAFVKDICAVVDEGDFPEVGSYEDLTKVAIALYETPEFKVGDKVKVAHRKDDDDDYPYSFTDDMTKLEGKEFIVKSCRICNFPFSGKAEKRLNEDPHIYELKDEGDFIWHSSMLEKVSESDEKSEESSKGEFILKPSRIRLSDLQSGYILKYTDTVVLCGETYRVYGPDCCFLNNISGGPNHSVFDKLSIKDREEFCSQFGKVCGGDFPVFNRLDALTACVKQLMLLEQDSFGKGDSGDAPLPEAIKCERINFTMDICEPDKLSDAGIIRLPEIKDDFKIIL